MPELLTESAALAVAATPAPGPGRIKVQLINPGWGSSGYYSAGVLEAAAKDKVFPKGTQMFVNHQTEAERYDRPEGDLRNLAAVLEEDAYWDGKALVGEARVYSSWRQTIADMAADIGVSIRASADVSVGEAEGRTGRLVTELLEGRSVDFVTLAGRGGKVLEVLESARADAQESRNVGQWLEARLHSGFTALADDSYGDGRLTREERIALSAAIGDALAAFTSKIEGAAPQLYQRDIWEEPDVPQVATEAAPTSVPSNPAGSAQTNESKEILLAKIEVDEAAHTAAVEASGRVPVLEAENARLKSENAQLQEAGHKATAAAVVAEAFTGIEAPATIKLIAASYKLDESGQVDVVALKATAEEAAAEHAVAAGAGRVHGAGSAPLQQEKGITAETVDATIAEAFGRTPKGAK